MRALAAVLVCLVAAVALAQEEAPRITKAPRLTKFVEAEYPPAKKAAGVTATVIMTIDIAADGHVENVAIAQSGGADFDAAATAAARQFVFEPAEVDGKPAPVRITYKYDFTVQTQVVPLGPQVNFEGIVLDRFKKTPLAGVEVALTDLGQSATTDDAGHFEFVDVPVGEHHVRLKGPRLITVSTTETIEKGQKHAVKYLVEPIAEGVDEEEVVRAPRIKRESVVTTLRTEEARRVPGTQGDTLKVVQNLPGVARAQAGTGQIIVWGAAPEDTRVVVDGVEIPALYHIGGLRATINSDLVRSIDLLPGAYGADYGRGLGGLVRIETKSLPDEGVHGYVGADVLDASALITAKIGKRLRIGVAGRYSYLDKILEGVVSPDVANFFPIPRYADWQAKATLALRQDEELSAVFLGSFDSLRRTLPSTDPGAQRSETTDQQFYRAYLRYTRLFSDGASVAVTPSFSFDRTSRSLAFGAVPAQVDIDAYSYGLRGSFRRKVARLLTLSIGVDWLGTLTHLRRNGSLNIPPREGDIYVFGQSPGSDVNADSWSTHISDLAPYAFAELQLGKLTITPGIRVDAFMIQPSRLTPRVGATPAIGATTFAFDADPRLTITYRPLKRVTFTGAAGIFHQAPDPADLSAVFGNPKLGLMRAFHFSLGGAVRITGTLTAEVVGFYKYLDNLVSRAQAPTPPLAQALTQDGLGQVYGGQLLLRQELFRNFFGWITYTISRSEKQDHAGLDFRLSDYDQTHVLGVVGSYEYRGWGFGVRFRYTSGFPRTPVIGAFYDGRDAQYQPIFGAQNSIRLPDFVQLDLRVEKTISFRRVALNVYLDAQNVTYQRNPEEVVYSADFSKRGYITGLPTLAVLGARLQF